jgi:riboflavin biosynthesis pyrimidine reductase
MTVAQAPIDVAIRPLVTHDPGTDPREMRGGRLPERLREAYGSDLAIPLRFDRPTVISNFVSTLDGVVSYNNAEAKGGGEISGFFKPDTFVMGLLRAHADAVLIGAGTLRAAPDQAWSARFTHPESAADFGTLRAQLRLASEPTTVVVTASGDVDLSQKGLADPSVPVLIITTERGADSLRSSEPFPRHVDVVSAGRDTVEPRAIIDELEGRGARVVLCEGGPTLYGQMLSAGLIDELFLTLAPQLAGRSDHEKRLSLVEGTAFSVASAPWARLLDLRRSANHLFTRYSFEEKSE